jgi:hypothetical protein
MEGYNADQKELIERKEVRKRNEASRETHRAQG